MQHQTDEQLMALIQTGNHAAFAVLHDRHHRLLLRQIGYIIYNTAPSLHADIPDILQNVFAFIASHCGTFRHGPTVLPWLCTTAKRLTYNHITQMCGATRDKRRQRPLVENYDHDSDDTIDNWEPRQSTGGDCLAAKPRASLEDAEIVARCLDVLPPRRREVIRLRYYEGLTVPAIADRLHITVKTAAWDIHEALQLMRQQAAADAK